MFVVEKAIAFNSLESMFFVGMTGIELTGDTIKNEIIRISNDLALHQFDQIRLKNAVGVLMIDGWESCNGAHLYAIMLKVMDEIFLIGIEYNKGK